MVKMKTTIATCELFLIIIILVPSHQQSVLPGIVHDECIEDSKTRTFSTLHEYQFNKISFDPLHSNFQGNNVNFSIRYIPKLEKNIFITFGSNSIFKISLDHKGIEYIDEGAFLELDCLHQLDLSYNNISSISKDAFDGLVNLKQIILSHNRFKVFPDLIKLYHVKSIDLSYNSISSLHRQLPALPELTYLDLSHNRIGDIKRDAFANVTALSQLLLHNNYLSYVEFDEWIGLNNLKQLNLAGNFLKSFDTTSTFNFVHLQSLNLSLNFLSTLNVEFLKKHLAELNFLDIRHNDWFCDDLDIIKSNLNNSGIKLALPISCSSSISIGTNSASTTAVTSTPSVDKIQTNTQNNNNSDHIIINDMLKMKDQILNKTQMLEERINHMENLLVYLFVIVVLFIAVQVVYKLGLCKKIYGQVGGSINNRDYFDANDSESVLLRG